MIVINYGVQGSQAIIGRYRLRFIVWIWICVWTEQCLIYNEHIYVYVCFILLDIMSQYMHIWFDHNNYTLWSCLGFQYVEAWAVGCRAQELQLGGPQLRTTTRSVEFQPGSAAAKYPLDAKALLRIASYVGKFTLVLWGLIHQDMQQPFTSIYRAETVHVHITASGAALFCNLLTTFVRLDRSA